MGCIVYQTNKKTGIVYAYWNESYRDPVTKKPTAHRTYMGRVDPETKMIIEKAEKGKRNRSKIDLAPAQASESSVREMQKRMDELQLQLAKANETITKLTDHVKRTDAAIKKLGDVIGTLPPYQFV